MQPTAHDHRRSGLPLADAHRGWRLALWAAGAALHGAPLQAAEAAAAAPAAAAAAQRAPAAPARPADKTPGKAVPAGPLVAVAPSQLPASDEDPMERLRQLLGERLTIAKPAEHAAGPLEVRVLAKAAATAQAARAPARAGAGQGRGQARVHDAHAPHWSYAGPAGPQTWGGLKPDFALCAKGQRQSPIDIQGGLPVELEPVHFSYKASRFGVVDNGHTVQANLAGGNFIEVGGRRFELKQFHFHRPSEERIDGRQFEMSLHLVHQDEQGRLAVVALLMDRGTAHPAVQKVWNNLPLEKQEEIPARALLELAELLPDDHGYYTYMGSLTTPPCSEGVQWIVMRQPVSVSAAQIELFARLYPMNARPLQQLAGRRILQSQ
jgi:carbonic anhydrase